jgi:signal transduction histidine kinase/DNA-binding LacI/PurR family transcriptional regulator
MKRIAFLLDYLYAATYQQEAVTGLVSAADSDVRLSVFLGGPFDKDPYDPFVTTRNSVYNLIARDVFDGIIVCNSVGNYLSPDEVDRFLARYEGIPIVFFGNGPAGYPRVTVDNVAGMAGLIRHFVADHGYRRVAFITGPPGNREAQDRLAAYRAELEKAGLPFAAELVVEGDFNVGTGMEAVRTLLDERRARFDALVASNDFMALGAKLELEKRGVAIPNEVALAGFDDTKDAICIIPSLTTVRQPFDAIAKKALAALTDGANVPPVQIIPGEIVIRQSCGCFAKSVNFGTLGYAGRAETDPDVFYAERRTDFIRRIKSVLAPAELSDPEKEIGTVLDAFCEEIARGTDLRAFRLMQTLISRCIKNHLNVAAVHDMLSLLRNLFSPVLKTREAIERAENFCHMARLSLSDVQDVQNNQNMVFSLKQTDQLSEVSQFLFSTVESSELANVIYRTFPMFNINNFLFAEFIAADGGAEKARVIALIRDGHARPDAENAVFSPSRLFPDAVGEFDVRVSFVLPVVYQEKKLGFVIFEKIERRIPLYPSLTGGFAGSFYYEKSKGLQPIYFSLTRELAKSHYINRLISMRQTAEESLMTLTAALEFRNRELEDFAHIASHDLKEPLRKIVSFSEQLSGRMSGKIDPEDADHLARMRNAALRMNGLIDGLLAYSRVATNTRPAEQVDLAAVVAEVVQDLEVRVAETGGRVEVGEMPRLSADALQMRELFQNLIGNALKYHRPNVPPLVSVRSERRGGVVEITVSDNGIGFDTKDGERIFGIFQRLVGKSEYEGSGVGLAICKKIVEKHNGTIQAYGDPGKGAKFVIRLPANA